ncbi:MAG: tRNA (adenosine(37)-N6)-threonylcarbamoyltransferase complex dimerization subunit type 1 TsaB [Acidobacteriota bacterium]
MKVLGIDTSGPGCSVALLRGEAVVAQEWLRAGARASREMLPALDRVLARAGVDLADVDAFAAVRGPGSFTGLRVGLATARGLAMATGLPAAGFCALDLLVGQVPEGASHACAWIDAGRGEIFCAAYVRENGLWCRRGSYELCEAGQAVQAALRGAFIGSAADRYRERIEARGDGFRVVVHRSYLAEDAARAWARECAAGRRPGPESLRPLYIRPSDAERRRRWPAIRSEPSA